VAVDPSTAPPEPTVATQMSALDALIAELRQPGAAASDGARPATTRRGASAGGGA
jgi:hypothetical protein